MTEDERRIHEDTTSTRNADLVALWTVNGIFSTTHFAGLVFTMSQITERLVLMITCSFGVLLGIFWLLAAYTMWDWLAHWNNGLIALQEVVDERIRIFGDQKYNQKSKRLRMSQVMTFLIIVIMYAWFILFLLGLKGILPIQKKG
ncbi:MAG TPA: hypothetical protein VHF05_00335 [Candidatus Paceibacterota bacterium]|nr:hypothetical protein [Candidatus Paceibacterota bacterium]